MWEVIYLKLLLTKYTLREWTLRSSIIPSIALGRFYRGTIQIRSVLSQVLGDLCVPKSQFCRRLVRLSIRSYLRAVAIKLQAA